ncbi:MAG: class I SAM-dependent methyltransferase [Hyphomicrobiaceae bacterium]
MDSRSHAHHLDRNYRYQRHVYDLTREYYLLGRTRMISGLDLADGMSVLEIGCGTALNLIRACRRMPGAEFHGLDLSRMMLETAARALAKHDLGSQIRLARGDATDFDATALFGRGTFDRVFLSYSLSMIPPWEQALDHAARLLSAGGQLHIVDFGRCEALPAVVRSALHAWLARFRVFPREDLEAKLHRLAGSLDLDLDFKNLYRGYSCHAVLRRKQG